MAKKFMFVCVGILALTVAFLLGAQYGSTSIVDHSMTGVVAHSRGAVLLDNGEVWGIGSGGWVRCADCDPPVAVSQLKFWDAISDPGVFYLVTTANELWCHTTAGGWYDYGPPPGAASATQPSTWGSIKAQFK